MASPVVPSRNSLRSDMSIASHSGVRLATLHRDSVGVALILCAGVIRQLTLGPGNTSVHFTAPGRFFVRMKWWLPRSAKGSCAPVSCYEARRKVEAGENEFRLQTVHSLNSRTTPEACVRRYLVQARSLAKQKNHQGVSQIYRIQAAS